ncbi:MAG TPA: hypothetical protein VIM55_10040 [Mucilaginibacter sp.]
MKRIVLFFITIVLLMNLPFLDFISSENYVYRNIDGSFNYSEEGGKGNSFKSCLISYGAFLCEHPEKDTGDNKLYRTFTIKPWRFWEWREYIFHSDRFTLPYLPPK